MEIWEAVEALPDRILVEKFKKTVTVIQRTMELYGYAYFHFNNLISFQRQNISVPLEWITPL